MAILAITIAGLAYAIGYSTHYFKLTYEFEVDGKPQPIAATYGVTTYDLWLPGPTQLVISLSGDALFVDLGSQKNVVVLLTGHEPVSQVGFAMLARDLLILPKAQENRASQFRQLARMRGARAPVPRTRWPQLGIFEDKSRLEGLSFVSPEELAQRSGGTVSLRAVNLEVVEGPESRSLDQLIPWIRGKASGWDFARVNSQGRTVTRAMLRR